MNSRLRQGTKRASLSLVSKENYAVYVIVMASIWNNGFRKGIGHRAAWWNHRACYMKSNMGINEFAYVIGFTSG